MKHISRILLATATLLAPLAMRAVEQTGAIGDSAEKIPMSLSIISMLTWFPAMAFAVFAVLLLIGFVRARILRRREPRQ